MIEARAKVRLADEYDAAQKRGEVARLGDNLPSVAGTNAKPATAADIGLRRVYKPHASLTGNVASENVGPRVCQTKHGTPCAPANRKARTMTEVLALAMLRASVPLIRRLPERTRKGGLWAACCPVPRCRRQTIAELQRWLLEN